MTRFAVGQPVSRLEDPRLLRGQGRFLDDMRMDGLTRAYVLRSPHPHAAIRGIDTAAAKAMPGVLLVLTGADYAASGLAPIPCVMPFAVHRPDGSDLYRPTRPALARDRVRFVGDAVALVVAETLTQARDAAEAIEIDYDPLPAVPDIAAAGAAGAPLIWEDCPGNLCFLWDEGDAKAVAAALATAPIVVRDRIVNQRISANSMEPRGAIAVWDEGAGRFTLHAGLNRPHAVRQDLAQNIFGLPESALRLVAPDMGGSFGMKGGTYPENVLVLWAARLLGRPVKWVADRSESFMSDNHSRDDVIEAALALDADGRFLAMKVEAEGSLGAYLASMGPQPKIGNLGTLAGVYTTPAIHVRMTGRFTNANPVSPYRGSGRPEACYVMERMVDRAAKRMGIDPAELRRRNLIPPDRFPYKTALAFTYDSGDFEGCLDKALAAADWAGFPARRRAAEARGMLRGIGLSMPIEQAGGRFWGEMATLRVEPDGAVTLAIGTVDWGMGHRTAFTQMICERLGVAPEAVRVVEGDTDAVALGNGTAGSRGMGMGGSAIYRAADKLIEKGRRIAAHALEAAVDDIAFADGRFTVAGTDRGLDFNAVARLAFTGAKLPPDIDPGLTETGVWAASVPTFPNGAHICEVEIDPETGVVRPVAYTVVDDVGTVVNPLLLKGQIQGGVVQGLGQVLGERIVYDPQSGQLLTASFTDYVMPRAADLCFIEVGSHAVPTPTNPTGAKGAGEAGTVGALPAAMNAINDALDSAGAEWVEMPATAERVWRAIRAARSV
ncbi:MAG: xanthine dehydrogenase family protein molybdopterin-binding subunit [Alphaproteobacteria bacterium]